MEIELRWVLIVVSLVILLIIVLDGWRRIKRQQKNNQSLQPTDFSHTEAEDHLEEELYDELVPEEEVVKVFNRETTANEILSEELTLPMTAHGNDEGLVLKKTSVVIDETMETMPDTIFVINVLASPGRDFSGSQLLPALLSLGLRYGEMSIFHRHEHINGNGAVLFSLASATEPGIFDLHTMESQNFYGLTLFLQVPGPTHPTNALNLMIQTAKRLAKTLDANIYDDQRQPLTDSNLERRYYFRLRQILGKI